MASDSNCLSKSDWEVSFKILFGLQASLFISSTKGPMNGPSESKFPKMSSKSSASCSVLSFKSSTMASGLGYSLSNSFLRSFQS